jgi:hypothetical protein
MTNIFGISTCNILVALKCELEGTPLHQFLFFLFFLKVWWQAATLFIYFTLSEHTYNIYIYNSLRTASCNLHRFCSVEGLLWGAEPRFELGPALQQADALLFVPRRGVHQFLL